MNFISVQEAAEATGKSPSTITRFARKYENSKHVRQMNKQLFIDESFLFSHYSSIKGGDESMINHSKVEPEQPEPGIADLYQLLLDNKAALQESQGEQQRWKELFEATLKTEMRISSLLREENRGLREQLAEKDEQIAVKERLIEKFHTWTSGFRWVLNNQTRLLENLEKRENERLEKQQAPPAEEPAVKYKPFRWGWLNRNISFFPLLSIAIVALFMVVFREQCREFFGLATEKENPAFGWLPLTYFIPALLYAAYSYLKDFSIYNIPWVWKR